MLAGALLWTAYVACPFGAGGLFSGVPLGPLDAVAVLVVWWLTVGGSRLPDARIAGSVLAAALLVSLLIPDAAGFHARYFANAEAREPFERGTEIPRGNFTRIDGRLEFARGESELPLVFFNDIERFNFYHPHEPQRGSLAFAVVWNGYWRVDSDGAPRIVYVDAPRGVAQLIFDGVTVVSVTPSDGPRTAVVTPARGWHQLHVRFSSPYGAPRSFSAGELIDNRRVPFDGASVRTRRIASWRLTVSRLFDRVKTAFDACLLAWLAWLVAVRVRDISRTLRAGGSPKARRDSVLALLALVAIVEACVFASAWAGRLAVLGGGNDPMTYEFYSRDIQLNGLLLRRVNEPYYYQVLYPYFLAATHMIFGEGMFGVMLVQRLLVAFAVWSMADIAVSIRGDKVWPVAFACATLFAYVKFAPFAAELLSEALFIPLLVAWTAVLVRVVRSPTGRGVVCTGILGGLAALTRTTALLAWAVVFPVCWVAWKHTARRGLFVAVLAACLCGLVSLIAVRNWIVVREFAPIPTEGSIVLLMGNEPPPGVQLDLTRRGPLYDRLGLNPLIRQVVEYAITEPGMYVRNLGRKALFALGYYDPYVPGWGYLAVYIAVWVASAAGFAFTLRARAAPAIVVSLPAMIAIAHLAAVVMVHLRAERLILPFYAVIVPYAAVAVDRLVRRGR